MGGGFTPTHPMMSDRLQRQLALNDAKEQHDNAVQQQRYEQETADRRERAFQLAVNEAVENGTPMLDALAGKNLGHTPAEFIAKISEQQDYEDAMAAAKQQREFNQWQLAQSADNSFDKSDSEAETAKWKAYDAEHGAARAERDSRRHETRKMIRADRRLREMGFKGV
jgi:hypothetical protein